MSINKKTHRLKTIKAVYTSMTVAEEAKNWFHPGATLSNSTQVAELFGHLKQETKEVFASVHLGSKNNILCVETVSVGSLNAAIVHPREVFKTALLSSAAAILLIHNHPSGDPAPSKEDIELTQRLKDAGELLGIRVLDHIIIGDHYMSFADSGLL